MLSHASVLVRPWRLSLLAVLMLSFVGTTDTYSQSKGKANRPPTISNVAAYQVANKQFRVTGFVGDENAGGCSVIFSGAASGTFGVGGNGNFDVTVSVPSLGTLTVQAFDGVQNGGSTSVSLANSPPTVSSFIAVAGDNNEWTFSGTVSDEAPAGLTVTLTGLPTGFNGSTATCGANGTFSVTLTLPANSAGQASADVTDWYGSTGSASTSYGS